MLYNLIAKEGWPGFKQYPADAAALEECILSGGDGDYLEIGVRMGGSAIFAAMVKKQAKQAGTVYGIDWFGDGMAAKGVTPEAVLARAKKFGVEVRLIVAPSDPFPAPEVHPVVTLIDGSHEYQDCLNDWNNVKGRTERFILFHDCIAGRDVEKVVLAAKEDHDWTFRGLGGLSAVFERCGSS